MTLADRMARYPLATAVVTTSGTCRPRADLSPHHTPEDLSVLRVDAEEFGAYIYPIVLPAA